MPLGTINRPALLNPDVIWRAAVNLAYDGRSFMGSQRQPGERTVESETIGALRTIGAIESPEASRFRFASRTDRGVSALGNVVAFDTSFSKVSMLRAINAAAEDVFYYGIAETPPSFSPRRAKIRWYRYIMDTDGLDPKAVAEVGTALEGRHDFRRFCKPDGRSTIKTVDRVTLHSVDGMLIIDLWAREFLRNMVRRTVAAMVKVGEGRASVEDVRSALHGRDVTFGLAPPEGLTLMDVEYGFEFDIQYPPTLSRRVRDYRLDAFARRSFADNLLELCR
jgi:tRNA pseudouridine38-40 synthase